MDAQASWAARWPQRVSLACLTLAAFSLFQFTARAAAYRTANFTVAAPTPQLAKEIGDAAEQSRKSLALEWLGRELPNWSKPCPIHATVAPNLGAGGATSFIFDRGEVFGWDMKVQGSRERVLDSVIPHEVMHTVFATHFRQPLPRWADEGACTTVEHHSEIRKQENMLITFLKTGQGIDFRTMFGLKEYPQNVLPLYAQGHSLARFLIDQKGKRAFLTFLGDGMEHGDWDRAIDQHYGFEHLLALQNTWLDWIKAGRPQRQPQDGVMLASAQQAPSPPAAPESRGEVAAGTSGLAHELESSKTIQEATAHANAVASSRSRTATPMDPVAVQPTGQLRSVYGENAAWRPQKRRPITPTSSTRATQASGSAAAAYDASRKHESAWR
jgi:hypothetical protein